MSSSTIGFFRDDNFIPENKAVWPGNTTLRPKAVVIGNHSSFAVDDMIPEFLPDNPACLAQGHAAEKWLLWPAPCQTELVQERLWPVGGALT